MDVQADLSLCYSYMSKDWVSHEAKIKYMCVFQGSQPHIGFCPNPKHFIVNCEQNVVKFAEKWGEKYWKIKFLYEIFQQNKMLWRSTIPSFFEAETWHTYIFFAWCGGGERGGSVVECRTPEREVGGSKPTTAVLCP